MFYPGHAALRRFTWSQLLLTPPQTSLYLSSMRVNRATMKEMTKYDAGPR
jgi:hypothetical protein